MSPLIAFFIVIIILVLFLVWLFASGRAEAAPAAAPPAAEPAQADDLKKIEGIGPKVASLLQTGGIATFAQLAAVDVDQLKQILDDADLGFMDPGSWAQQAQLAAGGKWEELQKLQDELQGGR